MRATRRGASRLKIALETCSHKKKCLCAASTHPTHAPLYLSSAPPTPPTPFFSYPFFPSFPQIPSNTDPAVYSIFARAYVQTKAELEDQLAAAEKKFRQPEPSATTAGAAEEHEKEAAAAAPRKVSKIILTATAGPYQGRKFTLKVRKAPLKVGRSRGAAFVKKGLSLSKDNEVSTTHGHFIMKDGAMCFNDTGSTNGSFINGERIKVFVAHPVKDGDELLVGATHLNIMLEYTD